MNEVTSTPYPGSEASPNELYWLATSYRDAATQLMILYMPGDRTSLAPMRLCALQEIELYLAAYLREKGMLPTEVRRFNHNSADMAHEARNRGLALKRKVQDRLESARENREYLLARYEPRLPKLLEPNAIFSTLRELHVKVGKSVTWKRAPEGALPVFRPGEVTPPADPSRRA